MEKPTRVRHAVLFMICLVYFIAYLDRINIAVAAPTIMRELGVSKIELGAVFASFSAGYMLFQIPIGRLGDKLGPRRVLTGLVAFWSVMTGITGLAWNLSSMVAFRFLFGVGQAGAFPNGTRAFSNWTPCTGRGFVQGLTQASARFGGAAAPWIVAPLMAEWGWRPVFFFCAVIGLIWAILWYFWYRDSPVDYQTRWGSINSAEQSILEQGKGECHAVHHMPVSRLLRSRNMWALGSSYFCYCYCLYIYLTWLPTYLIDARGFTFLGMGLFSSLPLLVGGIGAIAGGWISDWIISRTENVRMSRRVVAIFGLLWAVGFMVPGVLTDSPIFSGVFLTSALFGLELSAGVYWAVCLDVGHDYAGTISGMMNSFGGAGSIISPFLFGAIVQYSGSWLYPFFVSCGLLVIGALLWLWIDPALQISEELDLERSASVLK